MSRKLTIRIIASFTLLAGCALAIIGYALVVPVSPATLSIPTSSNLPLPTITPKPTSTVDKVPPEVKQYAIEAARIADLYADALSNLSELMLNPQINNDEWITLVAFNAAIIRELHQMVIDLNPPSDMEDVHARFLRGAMSCSKSMDYMIEGLDNFDADALENAGYWAKSCGDRIGEAGDLLDVYMQDK